jgi:hypothetical protein
MAILVDDSFNYNDNSLRGNGLSYSVVHYFSSVDYPINFCYYKKNSIIIGKNYWFDEYLKMTFSSIRINNCYHKYSVNYKTFMREKQIENGRLLDIKQIIKMYVWSD